MGRGVANLPLFTFRLGAYTVHVHLNGGDAFSAGDFFAGVSVEFQETGNRQCGDHADDDKGEPEIGDGQIFSAAEIQG